MIGTTFTSAAYQIAGAPSFTDTGPVRRWLLLLITACANPGEAGFQRGGTSVGENRQIYFETWEMDFAQTGLGLPISLGRDNGGPNLLKLRDPCRASLVGVGLSPAAMASGEPPGGINTEFKVVFGGPAVVRVQTSFELPYSCAQSGMQTLSGTSTFTFFPNGRVVRTDENLIATRQALPDSTRCTAACSPGDAFHFTSFWGFVKEANIVDDQGVKGTVLDKPACVIAEGLTIGIKYTGNNTAAAIVDEGAIVKQELTPQMTSWPGDLAAQRAQSQLVLRNGIEPTDCGKVLAALYDPAVMIDGEVAPIEDGIYLATQTPHRGRTQITTATALPDGFALLIDLGGATHARVKFNGQVTSYYIAQLDGPQPLFFLPPITSSDTLTIEPL
jgi:hypothetical protein